VLFSDAQAQSAGERAVVGAEKQWISGKIQDKLTALPLEGVKVEDQDYGHLAFSDQNGEFELAITNDSGNVVFSFPDYEKLRVAYSDGQLDRSSRTIKLNLIENHDNRLQPGDSIPPELWSMRLPVFNHPKGRTHISLEEYRNKRLLVLDFWAPWCKPCVEAMERWNGMILNSNMDEVAVIGVNVGSYERSLAYMESRSWLMPCIYGRDFIHLNNYFFTESQVGGQVWILDDKLYFVGFSKDRTENREMLDKLLSELMRKEVVND